MPSLRDTKRWITRSAGESDGAAIRRAMVAGKAAAPMSCWDRAHEMMIHVKRLTRPCVPITAPWQPTPRAGRMPGAMQAHPS